MTASASPVMKRASGARRNATDSRDVLGLPLEAPQRGVVEHDLPYARGGRAAQFGFPLEFPRLHGGFDVAGAHAVDGDAVLAEFVGHRLREADDAELGRHVIGQVRHASLLARHRCGVDDRARRADAHHRAGGGLPAHEHAPEVDVHGLVVALDGGVEKSVHERDPRIAHPGVEAKAVGDVVGHACRIGRRTHVQHRRLVLCAIARRQCRSSVTRGVAIDIGDDDPPPPFGESHRDGAADAGARAGNHDCLGHR